MAYVGFDKLKKIIGRKGGVKNPGAVAAKIGMEKYGKKAMEKHAHSGTSMKNVSTKKK
jgi:hypothetical protein